MTYNVFSGTLNPTQPVCNRVRPMLSVHCLSVLSILFVYLSVTLVYYGQTIGWIKIKLGMKVGLSPGHIVLDGDPALPFPKGHSRPIFGPCLLRLKSWLDQGATWYGGKPLPRHSCDDSTLMPSCIIRTKANKTRNVGQCPT